MKLAIFASGNLGAQSLKKLLSNYNIVCVFTDSSSQGIVTFCKENSLNCYVGNPRDLKAFDYFKQYEIDVLFSINYLYLLPESILNYPKTISLNIHGSLLPKYRGRTPHVWAIINGEKSTGVTIHRISLGCDEGDILLQKEISISATDSGNSILNRFAELYPDLIEEALKLIESNHYQLIPQDHAKATFFGKRTPEDGQINWEWDKLRLINWVRALKPPYPGAFANYFSSRVWIDEAIETDLGFHFDQKNGLILDIADDKLFVKICNSVLQLKVRDFEKHTFQINTKLT